ncbi:ABC transporter ATP-binding protein [Sphingomonas gilva]|uniref:ABC transporter ATP-binding protein n=1 Tax=Sphingomonas gilva TaxID=2305907 RepID=A0A396RYM3_9SPHN|nr:ABC transporter ATP-binding protein [Sphingomonas gilva]RHW18831.1 ABC transporter ATP-binding protein [Sphingomonas gilva]
MGLSVERATVRRSNQNILTCAGAEFRSGKVTALLGPNGAGKTSLLRVAAGLIAADKGAAVLDGAGVRAMDRRARARAIGYLPQSAGVAWDVRVAELVALGRMPHVGAFAALSAEDEAAVARAIAACDLGVLADRAVGTLSGGERARAMLARVLAGEPRWILADEPLASLDPAHQKTVLDLLRDAARAGAGVVIVLHELAHAAFVADDAVLMAGGRVIAAGQADEVLTADRLRGVYGLDFTVDRGGDGRLRIHSPF